MNIAAMYRSDCEEFLAVSGRFELERAPVRVASHTAATQVSRGEGRVLTLQEIMPLRRAVPTGFIRRASARSDGDDSLPVALLSTT